MPDDSEAASRTQVLKPGQQVYNEAGRLIGVIQAVTETGVEVNTRSDVEALSLRQSSSVNLGEGYLVWRCSECGELGDIDQIPEQCPSCGASRENLYAYLED